MNVIMQSTDERRRETVLLFEKIRPLLDDGYIYSTAIMEVNGLTRRPRMSEGGWYRDLVEYGESQGYPYSEYSFRKRR